MKFNKWIEATRPKTLAAGIVPVLVGSSAAYHEHNVNLFIMGITLLCSVMIQIITNFFNEFYDFKKGADNENRIGPKRQVASGDITPQFMMYVTIGLLIVTFLFGLILVQYAGILILFIGIISLLFAFLYTGGPYPLAYKGLGDIFVFIFFGLIAVNGSYYVQTGEFSYLALISSVAPGLLSANILNVNNIRDIETDYKVGKITLSYRIGKKYAILMYRISTVICYIIPFILYIYIDNFVILLPFLSLPLALKLFFDINSKSGSELNKVLAMTGVLLLLYGILNSISLILAK
jgi:1,4-dihydroxy-2-naphthoate octaprenyltransferase